MVPAHRAIILVSFGAGLAGVVASQLRDHHFLSLVLDELHVFITVGVQIEPISREPITVNVWLVIRWIHNVLHHDHDLRTIRSGGFKHTSHEQHVVVVRTHFALVSKQLVGCHEALCIGFILEAHIVRKHNLEAAVNREWIDRSKADRVVVGSVVLQRVLEQTVSASGKDGGFLVGYRRLRCDRLGDDVVVWRQDLQVCEASASLD
jgi:hypothetical protein